MKASLGDVKFAPHQTQIELLDIEQFNFELKSLKIDFAIQDRMKSERIIWTRGDRQPERGFLRHR